MLRLSLILSGLLSFWFFLKPASFGSLNEAGKVLGVNNLNQTVNRQTVYQGLLGYCLANGNLPANLNDLYTSELSGQIKIDLNTLYDLKVLNSADCEFDLTNR